VPVRFPCAWPSCSSSRILALCAAMTTSLLSRTSRALDVANRLLWQLSFPAAPSLSMCSLTQDAWRRSPASVFLLQLLSTRKCTSHNLKQCSLSRYGLVLNPFSYFLSAQSFSEEKVRTPCTCCWTSHSPLIKIFKALPPHSCSL
jgi:hypothetical protein